MSKKINIIGAGLAGSEAAWQIANQGINVTLYEMRPQKMTEAHKTGEFGELVCSNSLRANNIENAAGLLKEELRQCDSLIMACADANALPAGGALAVDRENFARDISAKVKSHPLINIVYDEITSLEAFKDEVTIIATGPLTSEKLFDSIREWTGTDTLYFYDAAAPIVMSDSIDYEKAFWQSRYNKGDGTDYLNCPLNQEEYEAFCECIEKAELFPTRDFEKEIFFEGCMPIEVMASRGKDTLRFGPMKPVGLVDPKTNKEPYAVVQLRRDNKSGTLMNLVGFQSRMIWGYQKEMIAHIPALKDAEIVRYGVMHRNTFLNSPRLLNAAFQLKNQPNIFFAGQITGVEGYIESTASGLAASRYALAWLKGEEIQLFPNTTCIGALGEYIATANPDHFQPMNINFGLLPLLEKRVKVKKERNAQLAKRSLEALKTFNQ